MWNALSLRVKLMAALVLLSVIPMSVMGFEILQFAGRLATHRDVGAVADELKGLRTVVVATFAVAVVMVLVISHFVVRSIVGPLNLVLNDIAKSSTQIGSTSERLTHESHLLSEGSSQQASAIQETVASMAEMSSMISQTADYARSSLESSREMADKASQGGVTMERMVAAMGALELANGQLENMANIINEISGKTAVINDIVFKTQLLSFNASIEAARAGQHGRGFAVVAEEVGNLAEMSGAAAKEIQLLLEDSKREVGRNVGLTKDRVLDGQEVSKESATIFREISEEIKMVTQQIEAIDGATREQEMGVNQTATAMTQLDIVAKRANELSRATADHASHLNSSGKILMTITRRLSTLLHGGEGEVLQTGELPARRSAPTPQPTPLVNSKPSKRAKPSVGSSALPLTTKSKKSTRIIELTTEVPDQPPPPVDKKDLVRQLVKKRGSMGAESTPATERTEVLSDDDSFKPMI